MPLLFKNRKAQSTMEYALLIAVVIGVFSAMQIYMRRSLQARIKSAADNAPRVTAVAGGYSSADADSLFGNQTQYEPYYMRKGESNYTTTASEGTEIGVISASGGKRTVANATLSRTGSQSITGAEEDIATNP